MPRERVGPPAITPNIHGKKHFCTQHPQVRLLRQWLQSDTLLGAVLRVLLHRLKYPDAPYTNEELAILMLLSVAELELV